MCTVFGALLGYVRMGLKPGTPLYQELKSPHSLWQAFHLAGSIFLVSVSVGGPLFCLSMCINDPHAYPQISDSLGEELGSFCLSTRGVHRGQLPCAGYWGISASHRGPMPTIGADLALSLLYVSRSTVSSRAWLPCVFLGDSATKMLWAEVFGFLFPVVGM